MGAGASDQSDPGQPSIPPKSPLSGRGSKSHAPSARRAYTAVDAIQGHLAANGAAPFPASKAAKLVVALDEVEALLAEGK